MLIGNEAQRAEIVQKFNHRFSGMEMALWCLSVHSRASLLARESSPVLEALVWTIKCFWSVQGVPESAKPQMAKALAELMPWSPELFAPQTNYGQETANEAREWVEKLIRRSMLLGVGRRECSWASKILHCLMPWRVPVLDSRVCDFLRVPKTWDLSRKYRKVTTDVFEMARMTAGECNWIGELEPRSQLRALDKYMWWKSTPDPYRAPFYRDPCKVLRQLGLPCVISHCR